jgi:tricorn protease
MLTRSLTSLCLVALVAILAPEAGAQVDARLFRQPTVSATHIAFVYAGDIWVVSKAGGVASRLSSPRGEEQFPRFSPDGARIAFSANYDGNTDVYVVPAMGGDPVRVTHHPMEDRLLGWHPDGKRVLFASSRESGRQRYSQFFLAAADGGEAARLPVPYGEFGSFSPNGLQFAYMPQSQDFRTWKRYRGGWAPDIWLFDLQSFASRNLTRDAANDAHPMWFGDQMYFMSDRGPEKRQNLWALDMKSGTTRQVTTFRDYDISFPSPGPAEVVFQAGGRLYLLDAVAGGQPREVKVQVVTDKATLKPQVVKVESLLRSPSVSPTGKRAAFEARGDLFSVPAEHGAVVNLTNSSGVAERYPRWSPDGKTLAYWTDRGGEYELAFRSADGTGEEQVVTGLGPGFRYPVSWSPDSRKLAFVDQAMRVWLYDRDAKKPVEIDRSAEWLAHGDLQAFRVAWSPDSRWLAWSRPVESGSAAIFLYDTKDGKRHQATVGYFYDWQPTFDPEGKYLFYASNRSFEPTYSAFDNSWTYPYPTRLLAMPLRRDVPSPLAQRNDVEGEPDKTGKPQDKPEDKEKEEKGEKGEGEKDQPTGQQKPAEAKPGAAARADKPAGRPTRPAPVEIHLDGLEARAVILPPKADTYQDLQAVTGKLLYRRLARQGSGPDAKNPIVYYDLAEREEKTLLDDADGFEATFDGKKLLVGNDRKFAIVEVKAAQKFEKPMRTAEMQARVDPRAEWRQIFTDAYRFERDYFYDSEMHGVNWPQVRDQYLRLLDDAVTRWDVNFVLGEFIAELNASHTYRGGGDEEAPVRRGVGLLGVDWALDREAGAYQVKHIVAGGPWDIDARSPLAEPGVNVKEGDYILAVNGVRLEPDRDPWAAFEGLADMPVTLTVNDKPTLAGSRQVVVKTLGDDTELRFREWIEKRRKRVDEATGGRAGYIYVQSTGVGAQNELVRQFMAQWRKDGLVIDERWNSGGQIPDRFIELLNRPMLSYWATRDGETQQWPPVSHAGPKVMLINGWSGSGGDAFPFYFREARVGPLVGTRTWGGLIGISGAPSLVDGGGVTVPTFRMFDVRGKWFAEGYGVEPDIPVEEDPTQLAKGVDPQLERAIDELKARLAKQPAPPVRPAPEKR